MKSDQYVRSPREEEFLNLLVPVVVFIDSFLKIHVLKLNLLHSVEQAVKCIGHFRNSDKTKFICLNQDSAIFSLNSKPLDKLIHLSNYMSAFGNDVNICIGKHELLLTD